MHHTRSRQLLSIPRSFVCWGAVLCALAFASTLALCVVSALIIAAQFQLVHAEAFSSIVRLSLLAAFAGIIAAGFVGIVLNGYLPTLFQERPKGGWTRFGGLLRVSVTSRFVLLFWVAAWLTLLSAGLVAYPLGWLAYIALTGICLCAVVVLGRRYYKFSRSAGRTPLYEHLSDEQLGTLFRATQFDNYPEWEPVHSISSAERAEAYRQLARARYLAFRVLAALVAAASAAGIAAAINAALADFSGWSVLIAFIPFFGLLAAQFLYFLSEQYDSLASRYANKGEEFAGQSTIAPKPTGVPVLWRPGSHGAEGFRNVVLPKSGSGFLVTESTQIRFDPGSASQPSREKTDR